MKFQILRVKLQDVVEYVSLDKHHDIAFPSLFNVAILTSMIIIPLKVIQTPYIIHASLKT